MPKYTGYRPDLVFYHHPCSDGLASAAVVYAWNDQDDIIDFIPADYGAIGDVEKLRDRCRDKNVLLVDFTFKPDVIEQVLQTCESLLILDHHKNMGEQLKPWNYPEELNINTVAPALKQQKCIAIYSPEDSGATMAWKFFMPNEELPVFLEYIRDVDLHALKMDRVKDFQWFSRSIPFLPEEMAKYIRTPKDELIKQFDSGAAIYKFVTTRLEVLVEDQTRIGNVGGVPFAWNITDYAFASELANEYLDAGFELAIIGYFTAGGMGFSLRSKESYNCAALAREFGGNGHDQAAGFNIKWEDLGAFFDQLLETNTIRLEDFDAN